MTYQISILSSQKKPYPTLCASAKRTLLSTPASWRLTMLFWAFPMLHLQMTPSCKISLKLYYCYLMLPEMAWVCSFIQKREENARTKALYTWPKDRHFVMQGFPNFLFFNFSTTDLYFVLYKCVYPRYCYSSGILLSLP